MSILGNSGEIVNFRGEILAAKTCTSAAKSLSLFVTIPPHLRECFKEKFTKRGRGFKQYYTSEKVKRFERIVNPRQNNKKITKSKPSETEPKKRRKFLKRSKYKRVKRQQLKTEEESEHCV